MSRLKKRLEETDLELEDLYDFDDEEIEDRTLVGDENKKKRFQYISAVIAAILVIVVIIVVIVTGGDKDKKEKKPIVTSTASTENAETGENVVPDVETTFANTFTPEAYPEITELVKLYYSAKLTGDTAAIEKYVDNIEDVNMAEIKASNEYIKKYKNIECYTKPGMEENSYVVFAKYDIKFKNIETLAPGIDVLYVMRDKETSLVYIHNGATANADIKSYIETLQSEQDVVDLFNQVNTAFQQALQADAGLNEFYTALTKGTVTIPPETSAEGATANGAEGATVAPAQ